MSRGPLDRWRRAVQRNDQLQEETLTATTTTHVRETSDTPVHPVWRDGALCEVRYLTGGVGEWDGCHVAAPPIVVELVGGGSVSAQLRQFVVTPSAARRTACRERGRRGSSAYLEAADLGPVLAALTAASAAGCWPR